MADKATFLETLSQILISHRVMSPERAEELKRVFQDSPHEEYDDFLIKEGLIDSNDLLQALSVYYKVPSFDVVDHFFRTFLLHEFDKDFLLRNAIIPLEVENQTHMIMVAAEPFRSGLESAVKGFVDFDVSYMVGIRTDIIDAIEEYYDKAVTEVQQDIDRKEEEREAQAAEREIFSDAEEVQ